MYFGGCFCARFKIFISSSYFQNCSVFFIFYPFTTVYQSEGRMICGRWYKRDALKQCWMEKPYLRPSHRACQDTEPSCNPKTPHIFCFLLLFLYHIFAKDGLIVSCWGHFETNVAKAKCVSCKND